MYRNRDYYERECEYVERVYEERIEDYIINLPCEAEWIDYDIEYDEGSRNITFIFRLDDDITEDDLDDEFTSALDVKLNGDILKVTW